MLESAELKHRHAGSVGVQALAETAAPKMVKYIEAKTQNHSPFAST